MGVTAHYLEATDAELAAIRADPTHAKRLVYEPSTRRTLSLDKAWAGLHVLFELARYDYELDLFAFESGPRLGDHQLCCVAADSIFMIAEDLHQPGVVDGLAEVYTPAALAGVYPDIWARDGEGARDYLLAFVPLLAAYTSALADTGHGALGVLG